MQFDESLKKNIRNLCHTSTNEDGDVFVGIKADSNDVSVSFPLGYEIPKNDNEIRTKQKPSFITDEVGCILRTFKIVS